MQFIAAAIIIFLSGLVVAPRAAEAQEACESYRVKRGDDLLKISVRAYGYNNFRSIYRANRSTIGRNPNRLEIGLVLKLPCIDGKPAGDEAAKAPEPTVFSFVTANGYAPYTDEAIDNAGMFTHLVSKAMQRAVPDTPYEIVFVDDWSAHLETLLPRKAFDASFPWARPGCETQGTLTDAELYACNNYLYTDPFYEIVEGFFAKNGSGFETVSEFAGLTDTIICRPEGYPTGHLEEQNLMPPKITLVQPKSANDCFNQLMAGEVDLVALDTKAGDYVSSKMGLEFRVSENPHLYSIKPLRVALHKDNPKSADMIEDLNKGLQIMLQSGEWGSVITESLKEQEELLN